MDGRNLKTTWDRPACFPPVDPHWVRQTEGRSHRWRKTRLNSNTHTQRIRQSREGSVVSTSPAPRQVREQTSRTCHHRRTRQLSGQRQMSSRQRTLLNCQLQYQSRCHWLRQVTTSDRRMSTALDRRLQSILGHPTPPEQPQGSVPTTAEIPRHRR